MAEGKVTVQDHLVRMSTALQDQHNEFMLFISAAQLFQFEAAAEHQLASSAHMDIAMDSFISACRLQYEMKNGG